MKPLLTALLLCAFTTLSPLHAADTSTLTSDAAKKDLAKLQGTWSMVSGSADGQSMPEVMAKEMKRICKGDELTVTMTDEIYFKSKIILDPAKTPKTIDYVMTDGPNKGKTQLGIYEIDGDTLKSCFTKPGSDRPADFKPGPGRTVSTWKHEKPAAQK